MGKMELYPLASALLAWLLRVPLRGTRSCTMKVVVCELPVVVSGIELSRRVIRGGVTT